MDIVLIRHGESEANKNKILISNINDPLTKLGIIQVKKLENKLNNLNFQNKKIFSSQWKRANDTAKILFPDDKIFTDCLLGETNPGIFESKLESEFNEKYPLFHKNFLNKYEGGESHSDMSNRIVQFIQNNILGKQKKDETLLIVTHGGPISIFLQYFLNISFIENYPSFTVKNATYSILRWNEKYGRFLIITVGSD